MASKILVDELAPQSHPTDVTLATGKKIAGANTQFKITGGSNLNHLQTDGAGNVSWVAPPVDTTGFSHAQQWRITADFSVGTGSPHYVYQNWAKPTALEFPGSIGSDMAVNATTSATHSGAWTFPVTGTWLVRWSFDQRGNGSSHACYSKIWVSNNNGAAWVEGAKSDARSGHNEDYNVMLEYMMNVDDIANDFLRVSMQAGNNTITLQGDANVNMCYMTFMRVGDAT